jgi:hypothetical protein
VEICCRGSVVRIFSLSFPFCVLLPLAGGELWCVKRCSKWGGGKR